MIFRIDESEIIDVKETYLIRLKKYDYGTYEIKLITSSDFEISLYQTESFDLIKFLYSEIEKMIINQVKIVDVSFLINLRKKKIEKYADVMEV